MKNILRNLVLNLLVKLAKQRLKTFKGKVVAITGSVGKTSTKDATFHALSKFFRVLRTEKSMNSEFGLPLTILEISSGFSSPAAWAKALIKGLKNTFQPLDYDFLVLEYGVDKPGDMDFLTKIQRADFAIVTNVSPVHMEEGQLKNELAVFTEKIKLVEQIKDGGVSFVNSDNDFLHSYKEKQPSTSRVFGYGLNSGDYLGKVLEMTTSGLRFSVEFDSKKWIFEAPVVGSYQVYTFLPVLALLNYLGKDLAKYADLFADFRLPAGRMSLIKGLNGVDILDSSYNSSPLALKEALKTLNELAGGKRRKVAVLGNMNELGEKSEILHREVAKSIVENADLLLTLGDKALWFGEEASKLGFDKNAIHSFKRVEDLIHSYEKISKTGDLILVKGSQNKVFLERFVLAFMENPAAASDLLVRQEKVWQEKHNK